MQVRGVDARGLQIDDRLFLIPDDKDGLDSTPVPSLVVEERGEQIARAESQSFTPTDSELLFGLQQDIESNARKPANAARGESQPLLDIVAPATVSAIPPTPDALSALSNKNTLNVRELQQSNFESLFSDMGIVGERVLTFPSDSTYMGNVNKAQLRELLNSFDPSSDVLSVIGCSLGPTNHNEGQEGLARGRANRVREELLYAGVPDSRILAEGCWAEETFDERMPRRGVVVTLKRPIT